MLVEVPLEDNRSAARPAKRAEAERIGHLHAFSRGDVRALIAAPVWVVGELSDPLPRAHHAFFAEGVPRRGRRRPRSGRVRAAAWKIAPEGGEKFFTVHYAVLTEYR